MVDNKFLILLLNLKKEINNNDKEKITELVKDIDGLSYEQEENIKNMLFSCGNLELAVYIIDSVNSITNKDYCKLLCNIIMNYDMTINELRDALNPNFTFISEEDAGKYYSILINKIVRCNDPDLIEAALNKMQELNNQ